MPINESLDPPSPSHACLIRLSFYRQSFSVPDRSALRCETSCARCGTPQKSNPDDACSPRPSPRKRGQHGLHRPKGMGVSFFRGSHFKVGMFFGGEPKLNPLMSGGLPLGGWHPLAKCLVPRPTRSGGWPRRQVSLGQFLRPPLRPWRPRASCCSWRGS